MPSWLRFFQVGIAATLLLSDVCFVFSSWHWPLVGDSSQIHYLVFLIGHGKAPYRDFGDMNMPGALLVEMAAMKVFGGGALGWRVFDFTLLAAAAAAFRVVTRRSGWIAAIFAGSLFALAHGRDGLEQGGQRDLSVAVLFLVGTAALFVAIRRRSWAAMFGFGLLAGVALTIKPTALLPSLAQLLIALFVLRKASLRNCLSAAAARVEIARTTVTALAGAAVGPLVSLGFMLQQRSFGAFWIGLHTIVPYYAGLGHRPLGFLLVHSISPLTVLVCLWFALLLVARPRLDWERGLLLAGAVCGLLSYVLQARGFPYHRYPELAFLLALMALDFTEELSFRQTAGDGSAKRIQIVRGFAIAALAFAGLFLAPQSALQIHRFRWWETDFNSTLEANLTRLGGGALSGRVQCIDWVSGCETTLYRMRLVSATGLLEDFLIFGPSQVPVIAETRKTFGDAVFAHPPKVIIVSSRLHIDGSEEYRKLDRWPAFEIFLAKEYKLDTDWKPARTRLWWGREEMSPGYRIYALKNEPFERFCLTDTCKP